MRGQVYIPSPINVSSCKGKQFNKKDWKWHSAAAWAVQRVCVRLGGVLGLIHCWSNVLTTGLLAALRPISLSSLFSGSFNKTIMSLRAISVLVRQRVRKLPANSKPCASRVRASFASPWRLSRGKQATPYRRSFTLLNLLSQCFKVDSSAVNTAPGACARNN